MIEIVLKATLPRWSIPWILIACFPVAYIMLPMREFLDLAMFVLLSTNLMMVTCHDWRSVALRMKLWPTFQIDIPSSIYFKCSQICPPLILVELFGCEDNFAVVINALYTDCRLSYCLYSAAQYEVLRIWPCLCFHPSASHWWHAKIDTQCCQIFMKL